MFLVMRVNGLKTKPVEVFCNLENAIDAANMLKRLADRQGWSHTYRVYKMEMIEYELVNTPIDVTTH